MIDVSDAELNSYIKDNSDKYQQESSRDIEYVVFSVNPSEDDRVSSKKWINDIKSDFANTDDDQNFINKNSDSPLSNLIYTNKDGLSKETESLFDAKVGTVIGPFESGFNKFRLAKLIDTQNRPDSVKARHILISSADAIEKIDSIKALIENGASFSKLAKDFSEDTQSAIDGGNLGWFSEGAMVAEFNEVCFSTKKGQLETAITQFGVHLIEVVSQSKLSKKVKVGILDRDVLPSNQTYQLAYTKAGKFAAENSNTQEFNASLVDQNLTKRIADDLTENSTVIAGLQNSRSLIKWANEADLGDVSQVFEFDSRFVVASLVKIKEEGLQDLEDVRAEVETLVRDQKRGEMLINQLENYSDLQTISQEYGVEVKSVDGLLFSNSQVPLIGQEPSFVGASFSVEKGQTTKPFLGKNSLYVVSVDDVNISASESLVSSESLISTLRGKTAFQLYQSLQDLTEIEDNRSLFY
jgi:peptidyl-prolyl cis-trans isomerase D